MNDSMQHSSTLTVTVIIMANEALISKLIEKINGGTGIFVYHIEGAHSWFSEDEPYCSVFLSSCLGLLKHKSLHATFCER